jgi:hypothetical protein
VSKSTAALQAQVICEILDLRIQPIRLELLGLILTTSEIRIRLRADSEGGLLGSLLCSLAGIDLGNLGGLVDLLNDILCQLTGLACV